MRVAIIGAAGKTGRELVRESLERGHEVVAVCRDGSAGKLAAFDGRAGFTVVTAPVVSDEAMLTGALAGCDGVLAVLLSVRRLKATELVASLVGATAAHGITRLAFTAGEVTAAREPGEGFTWRQRLMRALVPPLLVLTPYSVADMLKASVAIRQQRGWSWTIVRAPTLRDAAATGYRLCELAEITSAHALSRADYAASLLDSLDDPARHGRAVTVMAAEASR